MLPKPIWVLDTNVVVSGVLHPDRAAGQLLAHAVAGHFFSAYDARILAEYHEVLGRRKFGLPSSMVAEFINEFIAHGLLVTPHSTAAGLPDPDDEIFYLVARQCPNQIVVTGNLRHFPAAKIGPVKALTIRAALDLL
jgi:predicted nucleic acid-binding protein